MSEYSIWLRAACFPPGRRPVASTIYSISLASPSLPGEKPLALPQGPGGPTTEFSDKTQEIPPRADLRRKEIRRTGNRGLRLAGHYRDPLLVTRDPSEEKGPFGDIDGSSLKKGTGDL